MAKRKKGQQPVKLTRKYQSRVAQEKRQLRRIYIGVAIFIALVVAVLLAGVFKTQIADPAATRRAKAALKTLPAVTVKGTMVSIADWQARVRYERQLRINRIVQLEQQLTLFDTSTEFGQQIAQQVQVQIQEMVNTLELGETIGAEVLDQMLEEQLIRQEAARRGIVVTPEELQTFIEVNLFAYPYPPTPVPQPTFPAPTLAPDVTATPSPTATPFPTPRSLEDFQADYRRYTEQIREITEMSESAWREMIEGELYRQRLLDAFAADVEPHVQQVKGRFISTEDQETAQSLLDRLEAGESFEALEAEVSADTSESPAARAASFDWQPLGALTQAYGEEFARIVFKIEAGRFVPEVLATPSGRYYVVLVEGNETRELSPSQIEQQKIDLFQAWLDSEKQSEEIVFGDWQPYVPLEPSL